MNITRYSRVLSRLTRLPIIQRAPSMSTTIRKFNSNRNFSSVFSKSPDYESGSDLMDVAKFEPLCAEVLETLTDYFEEIVEADDKLINSDVAYSVSPKLSYF